MYAIESDICAYHFTYPKNHAEKIHVKFGGPSKLAALSGRLVRLAQKSALLQRKLPMQV